MPRLTKSLFRSIGQEKYGKRTGFTRKQVQSIFKSAMKRLGRTVKKVSKKGKTYYAKPRTTRKTRVKRGGGMARRKKRGRRNFKIPLTIAIPVAAGPFIPAGPPGWGSPFNGIMAGDYGEAARTAMVSLTFYDPGKEGAASEGFKLDGGNWLKGIIIGACIHKFVGGWPLNVNKLKIWQKLPFNL